MIANRLFNEIVTLETMDHVEWALRKLARADSKIWEELEQITPYNLTTRNGTCWRWKHAVHGQWFWMSTTADGRRDCGFNFLDEIRKMAEAGNDE